MPIYEYRCNACEQIFEEWTTSCSEGDESITCPVCGGVAERIISNTTFVLKGGGWYVSEYGKNSAASNPTKKDIPSGSSGCSNSSSSSAS
ncbi:FmdB family zinc ribbon protein [Halodesulfovibrio aestuarii]|uniref:Putative regulatory protein, FmdB family n=1 Tax=Halodesulfovibrio aestuarii TaxID=126333 RepID=A0A8G2C8Y8_9BACT|nr:zinc ribbon domain-containing protein [Halodesulfovibrio aestuarii]SHJ00607.1 putative regulatory protein, FmdB family [Halodesulfovibrio aestuarii]